MARDMPDGDQGGSGVEESYGGLDRRFWILQEFSLTLHPDKTRLIRFGRFSRLHELSQGTPHQAALDQSDRTAQRREK